MLTGGKSQEHFPKRRGPKAGPEEGGPLGGNETRKSHEKIPKERERANRGKGS